MSIFRINLSFEGDEFIPNNVIQHLNGEFNVIDQHAPEDLPKCNLSKRIRMKRLVKPYGYGSLTFQHPLIYGLNHNGNLYESWYVDIIENNLNILKEHNVDDIRLEIDVFYVDQCFIEVLDSENLNRLFKAVDIKFSIPMNVYKLKQEIEIVEMLVGAGYDETFVNEVLY
jgi:hypothetical protein